jgi:molybdopterin biosynthesis enzyme MoaB
MPYVTVDVDLDDVYSELRDREKQLLVDWLKEDGYLINRDTELDKSCTALQDMFNENINKIKNSYYQLTNEEIELIEKLAKKY